MWEYYSGILYVYGGGYPPPFFTQNCVKLVKLHVRLHKLCGTIRVQVRMQRRKSETNRIGGQNVRYRSGNEYHGTGDRDKASHRYGDYLGRTGGYSVLVVVAIV